MNIILLSGGSGKRLWPLSNEVRSKQFLKIFRRPDGSHESMLQRMFRMLQNFDEKASVTIATSENQVASIKAQLGDAVSISIEPSRRDTFPAIALAVAYLHDVKKISEDEIVVVCPIDPYIEADYFTTLGKLNEQTEKNEANLVLMGIEPTYASEKYGYIIPYSKSTVSFVKSFKEKPDHENAKEYIKQGALWNGGIFAFKLKYVLNIAEKILGMSSYSDIFNNYNKLAKISFDYAVVEKESKIQVIRFRVQWKDLGTWNTLTEAMSEEVSGNAVAADCENTHIINELQIPLLALGVKDLAIAATPDGILITDKSSSDKIKNYVTDNRPMYEKRAWGNILYLITDFKAMGTIL